MDIIKLAIFTLGLSIGSFVNVLIYRLPRGQNPVKGRSKCTHCNKTINFYDNIPLVSYLALLGKCRNCKKPISKGYFLVELVTGVAFVLIYLYLSPIYYLLIPILLAIFIIDLKHQIIPDSLIFILIIISILLAILNSNFYTLMFSGFAAAIFLLALNIITKGRGMGLGDVKYALFAGILLGWPNTLVFFYTSFILGALVGLTLITLKLAKLKKPVPFGPFLIIGTLIAKLFANFLFGILPI